MAHMVTLQLHMVLNSQPVVISLNGKPHSRLTIPHPSRCNISLLQHQFPFLHRTTIQIMHLSFLLNLRMANHNSRISSLHLSNMLNKLLHLNHHCQGVLHLLSIGLVHHNTLKLHSMAGVAEVVVELEETLVAVAVVVVAEVLAVAWTHLLWVLPFVWGLTMKDRRAMRLKRAMVSLHIQVLSIAPHLPIIRLHIKALHHHKTFATVEVITEVNVVVIGLL